MTYQLVAKSAEGPAASGIHKRGERQAVRAFVKTLLDESVDIVLVGLCRLAEGMTPIQRRARQAPMPALYRDFGPEETREAGGITVHSSGIVGDGDEGAAHGSTSRAGQREIKDVLIFGVLSKDSSGRHQLQYCTCHDQCSEESHGRLSIPALPIVNEARPPVVRETVAFAGI